MTPYQILRLTPFFTLLFFAALLTIPDNGVEVMFVWAAIVFLVIKTISLLMGNRRP